MAKRIAVSRFPIPLSSPMIATFHNICTGEAPDVDGVRNAKNITAQNSDISWGGGGGNYKCKVESVKCKVGACSGFTALAADFDTSRSFTRRERPFRSPRRVRFFNTTRKEQTKWCAKQNLAELVE